MVFPPSTVVLFIDHISMENFLANSEVEYQMIIFLNLILRGFPILYLIHLIRWLSWI